jgi:ankyrin repeat protein
MSELHVACYKSDLKEVTKLLKDGARVNGRDENKRTPLHIACDRVDVELVKILIGYKVHVNVADLSGDTPLHYLGLSKPKISTKPSDYVEIARILAGRGANARWYTNKYGETALHTSAESGKLPLTEALVEFGSDIHSGDREWNIPLHGACAYASGELVAFLCDLGSNLHARNIMYRTPLHIACINGNYNAAMEIVPRLNQDRVLSARDHQDKTPLNYARMFRHPGIVQLLLDAGAKDE